MTFAGCRRCKRLLLHASAFNLGLLMRTRFGYGPPRALQGLAVAQAALAERVAKAAYRYVIRLANGILRAVGLRMGRSWLRSRDRHADAPLQIDACCPPRIRSEPGLPRPPGVVGAKEIWSARTAVAPIRVDFRAAGR